MPYSSHRLSLHLKPLTGILCLVLPTRCVKGSISKDDLAFRNLLKAFNLCTPSADRFPTLGCSNCDSFDLNSILLHTTPKLSFYILMHSSSTSFPTYFPTPSLHHLQQWILHVPQQSSASKDEPEQGQVSENSILNLTALLISLQHSLFSWSSSGKRLALSSQMNQFLSKAMVKLLFEYCDSTPAALEECQEDGSISGFTLHVPDSLILLLLSTNLPPNLHNSPEIRAPDPEAGTSSHSRSRTCRARSISENKK